jgi:hypothetical protein
MRSGTVAYPSIAFENRRIELATSDLRSLSFPKSCPKQQNFRKIRPIEDEISHFDTKTKKIIVEVIAKTVNALYDARNKSMYWVS